MKIRATIAVMAMVLLAGCVTSHSIQPFGKDTYMMPTDVMPSYNARLANEYCAKRGLMMQPDSMNMMTFVFRCVDPKTARAEGWGPAPENVTVTVKQSGQ